MNERTHQTHEMNWLPFTTPGERVVSSVVLIAIATCSLLFGLVGGAVALGVYALGLKLYERQQQSQAVPTPGSEESHR